MRTARTILARLVVCSSLCLPLGVGVLALGTGVAAAQPGGGGGGRMMMGGMGAMFSTDAPLSSEDLARIGKAVNFTPDQAEAAKALLDGYLPEYQKKAEAQRKMIDDLREQFRESRDWTIFQDARPKMDAFRSYRQQWEKQVLADVQTLLNPGQQSYWPGVEQMRRRETLAQGMLSGERVDVVRLVDALNLPAEKKADVQPVLEAYAAELDRDLLKRNEAQAKMMENAGEAFRSGDTAKMEEMLTETRQASARVRDINRKYARQVEGLLPDDMRVKFNAQFKRESFPRIYRTHYPQQAIDAAMGLADLQPDQREAIIALGETYTRDGEALNARAEKAIEENEMTITAARMMPGGGGGGPGGGPGGGWNQSPAMAELRTARETLDWTTLEKLKGVLTPEQIAKLPEQNNPDGPGQRRGGAGGGPGAGGDQPANPNGTGDRPRRRRNPANPPAPAPEPAPKQG
jgi:hypothetical protein